MDLLVSLFLNVLILLGVTSMNTLLGKLSYDKNRNTEILFGVIFGLAAIIVMNLAWGTESGVFYDSRTVLISVVALMFNPLTTLIMTVTAVLYRIFEGGVGMVPGVITIVCTALIGLLWKYFVHKKTKAHHHVTTLGYGVIIHIFMLVYHFALPADMEFILTRIRLIAPVVLTLYPFMVVVMYQIVNQNDKRVLNLHELKMSQERYDLLFKNVESGIIHFDMDAKILLCNDKFAKIMNTTHDKLVGLDMKILPNEKLQEILEEALNGKVGVYKGYYTSYLSGKVSYLEAYFSPTWDNNVQIGGVGVILDHTERIKREKEIEKLSSTDLVTGFKNRKKFEIDFQSDEYDDLYPLQYAILSIDNFQFFIDTLGDDKSEQILINISDVIRKRLPDVDKVYRIAQNDFVVIVPKSSKLDLPKKCLKIKEEISLLKGVPAPVTVTSFHVIVEDKNQNWPDITNDIRNRIRSIRVFSKTSVNKNSIDVLLATLFEKSERERNHSERVSALATKIGLELKLDEGTLNRLRTAAVLHDIGKLNIESSVLDKPDKLTEEEYDQVKDHTMIGFRILSSVEEYKDLSKIVLSHHERWDGLGYPSNIRGEDIPIESRIICVADSFDAMINSRPYREALSKEEAIKELKHHAGTQFDPVIVDAALKII